MLYPSSLDALDLAIPQNAPLSSFQLPIPVVREKRTNRAAQTKRIGEPKAAAKILNLAPRIKMITDDDMRRLEAQNTIKRKREEREKKKFAEEIKDITPVLTRAGKTREGKASIFPQIRDLMKKAYKPSKAEVQTWMLVILFNSGIVITSDRMKMFHS